MHVHAPLTDRTPDPWYCEPMTRDGWEALVVDRVGTWWADDICRLLDELTDMARPDHSPAQICHLDVCPECSCATAG